MLDDKGWVASYTDAICNCCIINEACTHWSLSCRRFEKRSDRRQSMLCLSVCLYCTTQQLQSNLYYQPFPGELSLVVARAYDTYLSIYLYIYPFPSLPFPFPLMLRSTHSNLATSYLSPLSAALHALHALAGRRVSSTF